MLSRRDFLVPGDLSFASRYLSTIPGVSSSITNSRIDTIYDSALKRGALGGKLLGAGGGGFLLFYVPYHKQKKFIRHFKNLINVPFKFTSEGSNIMLNN